MNSYIFTLTVFLSCATEASCDEFIVHPLNATVIEGDDITIPCVFNDKVSFCRWYRGTGNVSIVDIKWPYSYNDTETNGTNTRDCSMIITNFTIIDEGFWQCSGVQMNKYSETANIIIELKSNKAHLTMDKSKSTTKATITQKGTLVTSEIAVHPQNATIEQGGYVLLKCNFRKTIEKCAWFRNGTALSIKDRYKYHNVNVNGENTYDCSIGIDRFSEIDATHWHCTCASNNFLKDVEKCKSNSAYLTLVQLDRTASELEEFSVTVLGWNLNITNLLILVVIAVLSMTIPF